MINKLNIISTNGGNLRLVMKLSILGQSLNSLTYSY